MASGVFFAKSPLQRRKVSDSLLNMFDLSPILPKPAIVCLTGATSGGRGLTKATSRVTDWATLGILAVVVAVLTTWITTMPGLWLLHIGLLLGYAGLTPFMDRWKPLRGCASLGVMFTLYTTLAVIPFRVIPWRGDAALAAVDSWLLGGQAPVDWVAGLVSPFGMAVFSLIYALFIPYLYCSIALGLFGKDDQERGRFVAGLVLTYAVSFLGYLFVPAQGPIVHLAEQLPAMVDGGYFQRLIQGSVDAMGGPHGAFPSLHVGASAFVCFFDLSRRRLRGWTYLPLVALIATATLVTRYHYAVDIAAGLGIALGALYFTRGKR